MVKIKRSTLKIQFLRFGQFHSTEMFSLAWHGKCSSKTLETWRLGFLLNSYQYNSKKKKIYILYACKLMFFQPITYVISLPFSLLVLEENI